MICTVNSPTELNQVEYYVRSSGISDVYLNKDIKEEFVETEITDEVDGSFLKTVVYTAEQVYFQIDSTSASKEDILNDFDYWFEIGKDLKTGELAIGLNPLKESKLKEVSIACENTIYNGIDVELSTGTEHFSLTEKDQINLFGKKMQLLAGAEKMEYHEDGQPCRYFTPEDMQKIVDNAMFFVSYNTTYCNALNMWIKSCTKPSELKDIYWGVDIPEEHMNEVLIDYMSVIGGK